MEGAGRLTSRSSESTPVARLHGRGSSTALVLPFEGAGKAPSTRLLGLTEPLDLLLLLPRQLARSLAAGHLLALDLVPDLVDDLRVRQRAHVSYVGEVGDPGNDPAHDLSGAGLRHVVDDPDALRSRDLADLRLDPLGHLVRDLLARAETGLQRDVHLDRPAPHLVDHRDRGRLGDLVDGDARRLELLGAQPVPGHVDHVVDPAEDPEVAIGRLYRAVAGEVRPVVPVLAVLVPAVLLVVGLHEPLGLAPDPLEDARPGIADADVARPAAPGLDLLAVLVVDHRVDAEDSRAAAAGLHRLQGRQGAAQEAAVLRLPPGVDDDRFALPDHLVVPAPDARLDRLAHRGHVLEVVVVLLRFVRPELAQHADRGGRGVEDVHSEFLGDPPGATGIRVGRHALVHDARRPERQGTVDDVGVPGDPPDVGEAPVRVVGVDVLVVLRRTGDIGEIPAGAVLAPLGAAGRAARIHEEQRRLGRHRDRLDLLAAVVLEHLVDEEVAALDHRALRRVLARVAAPDQHLVDLVAHLPGRLHRLVGVGLVVDELAVAVVAVHRHEDLALRVLEPAPARRTAEPAEHLGMD